MKKSIYIKIIQQECKTVIYHLVYKQRTQKIQVYIYISELRWVYRNNVLEKLLLFPRDLEPKIIAQMVCLIPKLIQNLVDKTNKQGDVQRMVLVVKDCGGHFVLGTQVKRYYIPNSKITQQTQRFIIFTPCLSSFS